MMNEMIARAAETIPAPRILRDNSTSKKKEVTAEAASKIADSIKKILRNMLSSFYVPLVRRGNASSAQSETCDHAL
jgi:hypothetical protein